MDWGIRRGSTSGGAKSGRRRWILRTGILLIAMVTLGVASANAYVVLYTIGDSTSEAERVPHSQTAIVLGAGVLPSGEPTMMLSDRISQAVALWKAGKVDRILVSGDHGTETYDEPDTMRRDLQAAGVPARVIFTDHAGFNTWSSMVRARNIFEVKDAVVVTQGFHMARALFLADQAGLEATGLTADLHDYGIQGIKSDLREVISRAKSIGDVVLETPAMDGPEIPIAGDDGRVSWGPQTPEPAQPADRTGWRPRPRGRSRPDLTGTAPAVDRSIKRSTGQMIRRGLREPWS